MSPDCGICWVGTEQALRLSRHTSFAAQCLCTDGRSQPVSCHCHQSVCHRAFSTAALSTNMRTVPAAPRCNHTHTVECCACTQPPHGVVSLCDCAQLCNFFPISKVCKIILESGRSNFLGKAEQCQLCRKNGPVKVEETR